MDHIVEIHSDVELNPSNNMQELEDRVKNAMRALQEIMKNKKQMENEKKELEQSLDNLKTDVEIIKKDELISLITLKNNLDNRLIKCLDEQTKNIIIARRSYHNINNKYWWSSIFILVFSSIITFIEAVRLIIENNCVRI